MHVGQTEVTPLELECQLVVVDPQAMQDRGVQVMHMDGVFGDVVAVVVGLAMRHTAADSAPGHPHRETAGVMIASIVLSGQVALTVDGSTELTAPHNQGIFQQSPLLEIADQRRTWLVNVPGLLWNLRRQVRVLIPTHMEQLDESDSSFSQPSSQQAVRRERPRFA